MEHALSLSFGSKGGRGGAKDGSQLLSPRLVSKEKQRAIYFAFLDERGARRGRRANPSLRVSDDTSEESNLL